MTLDPDSPRPLLMIAGSTGLAPMKAMIDQVARDGGRRDPPVLRRPQPAGDLRRQRACSPAGMARMVDGITTVISDDLRWTGRHGLVGDVAAGGG